MTLKTLLVHVDHDQVSNRLDVAITLARRYGARLTGLFAEKADAYTVGTGHSWPPAAYRDAEAACRAAFERATAGLDGTRWINANRGSAAEIIRVVTEAAHNADLAILAQDEGDGQHHTAAPAGMAEQVVLNAGRPVLIVPGAGHFNVIGKRVVIAWNNRREAARAVRDALPLLLQAEEVIVASFTDREASEDIADGCIGYLADYGIAARPERLVADGIGAMDLLLSRVAENGADLLVMGGHGHYAFPHFARGNGARHVLTHMTVPVLMSH